MLRIILNYSVHWASIPVDFFLFLFLSTLSALYVNCGEECIKMLNHILLSNCFLSLMLSAISCLLVSVNLDLSQYALDIVKGLASKYSHLWREL